MTPTFSILYYTGAEDKHLKIYLNRQEVVSISMLLQNTLLLGLDVEATYMQNRQSDCEECQITKAYIYGANIVFLEIVYNVGVLKL